MRPSTLSYVISYLAVGVAASMGGAGYNTTRVGPSNADCERKIYTLEIESNNTVFDPSLTSNINEVSIADRPICYFCADGLIIPCG